MPSIAASVRCSLTAIRFLQGEAPEAVDLASNLLSLLGETVKINSDQEYLQYTYACSAGLAYLSKVLHYFHNMNRQLGLSEIDSIRVLRTNLKSILLLNEMDQMSFNDIVNCVAPPDGITETGLQAMDKHGLGNFIEHLPKKRKTQGV